MRNSFFANSHLQINDVLLLGYLWLTGASYSVALAQSGHSSNTIVDHYSLFRQLVGDSLDAEDWTIGGEGIVVEVTKANLENANITRERELKELG